MIAVLRHELSSHYTNLTGYVFGAFLLLFAGIYMMVYNLSYGLADFEYVISSMAFIFLIIVPILTMRSLAEEKRQKTDQLLYSLSLSMTQIVLGKYLAMLIVFMLPMLIVCFYPVLLAQFGSVPFQTSIGAIIAFLFLGAALIAIGMFISSLTESQAVAAGVCFLVMLLNYYLADLSSYLASTALASFITLTVVALLLALLTKHMTKNSLAAAGVMLVLEAGLLLLFTLDQSIFEGLVPAIVQQLSLFERFYAFIDGVFDITSLVYFVSVSAVFVFLSIQAMEKKRWSA